MNKIHIVKSSAEFPSWQKPCPECGSKYEKGQQKGISTTRDGLTAWCKECKTNWKIDSDPRPEGWEDMGKKLGKGAIPREPSGLEVLTNRILRLEAFLTETSDGEFLIHCKEWDKTHNI